VHSTLLPLLFRGRLLQPVTLPGVLTLLLVASPASAQLRTAAPSLPETSPLMGGVPTGSATAEPIRLTVADAIFRALEHNLGLLLAEQNTQGARGDRWAALSRLLPEVSASITESRRKTNLEAFGFPLGPGFPRVVGPFNVFDARVSASQTLFDLSAIDEASAASHRVAASQHTYRRARDLVVLVSANLYLQALASDARSAAARAQFETSQALHQQAINLQQSGLVAGLDVVRAEVRMSTDRQRATAAANDAEKARLQLARVIGLPVGQALTLVDEIPTVPDPTLTLDAAVEQAYQNRGDYLAALEQLKAAEAMRAAAVAERLPSVRVTADYGAIGLTAGSALPTFNITGAVDVPIFDAGRQQAKLAQTDAELKRQQAQVADLKAEIYYDVRNAFLDLQTTQELMQTATRARELATQQLEQSRDRFAAGVASNIEVVQAQEAVALASDQYISAIYGFNIAKAMLAQSVGTAEDAVRKYLGGPTQ
jgi:outer membrane protein TolC